MQQPEPNEQVKPLKSTKGFRTKKPSPSKADSSNVVISSTGSGVGIYGPAGGVWGVGYQHSFPFNRVEMDLEIFLAPNPTSLKRDWIFAHGALVAELLPDLKAYVGLKRFHKQKFADALSMLLANLHNANSKGAQLLIPRNASHNIDHERNAAKITERHTTPVCEFLADQRYIHYVVGRANEWDGAQSWAIALLPLIAKFDQKKQLVKLHSHARLAVIRDSDKSALPPPTSERGQRLLEQQEGPVRRHNITWTTHTAILDGVYIIPWLRRIFNEKLDYGGRFYGEYQQLPSDFRQRILIDGEPTAELDYKSIHYGIMYALEGVHFFGDPYEVEGYARDTIKAVSVQLVNVEDLASFRGCITRSGNPKVIRTYLDYTQFRFRHDMLRAEGLKSKAPYRQKCLKGFIEGIPQGTSGEDLLAQLCSRHSIIQHRFGIPKIGVILQRVESEIMGNALDLLAGVPVLPVHDSIRCKVSDLGQVEQKMLTAYHNVTGQTIKVELK